MLTDRTYMSVTDQSTNAGTFINEIRLSELRQGEEAVISKFEDFGYNLLRLRDMGLQTGTSVRVIRFAPLGDPIEIKARGYYLSIRKSAAEHIWVNRK
jgi:ferrous iron transport protein A